MQIQNMESEGKSVKLEKQNQYLVLPPVLICTEVQFVQKTKKIFFFGFRISFI